MAPAVLSGGHAFLEAPRWDDGRLLVSDQYAERVLSIGLDGDVREVIPVPGRPSGLGRLPDGTLQVVSMTDATVLRLRRGRLEPAAVVGGNSPANDMLVDGAGRAYVGRQGYDLVAGKPFAPGALVLVTDGGSREVAADLAFPNGMALADSGRTLLVAETMAARITAFERFSDGTLGTRSVWAAMPGCAPDGIALDVEGGLWVADPAGHHVLRVERGGRVTDELSTGSRRAYACALGGPDGRTLFVCTATTFRPDRALERMSSAVETVRVKVRG